MKEVEFKKPYYAISEVMNITGIKDYVLRYWETEFPALKPRKIRGRRFYTPMDIKLILLIKELVYNQGFTIEGARKQILNYKDENQLHLPLRPDRKALEEIKKELKNLLKWIEKGKSS